MVGFGNSLRYKARQVERFDPTRACVLDDEARFAYVDPARIVELLDISEGGVVVDFGAGNGAYAFAIAERRPDIIVLALDDQPMLDRLLTWPRAHRDNLAAIAPNDARLAPGSIDHVFALNVLHELEDGALEFLRLLLTADGFAIVLDWDDAADLLLTPLRGTRSALRPGALVTQRVGLRIAQNGEEGPGGSHAAGSAPTPYSLFQGLTFLQFQARPLTSQYRVRAHART